MEQVTAAHKLHDKEEPFCGLKGSKEGGDEATLTTKSENVPFQQARLCSVLLQDILLLHNLDRAQLPCVLPLGKYDLEGELLAVIQQCYVPFQNHLCPTLSSV